MPILYDWRSPATSQKEPDYKEQEEDGKKSKTGSEIITTIKHFDNVIPVS